MNLSISAPQRFPHDTAVILPASKSISNRVLVLDALTGFKSRITNLSTANDTVLLRRMLTADDRNKLDAEDAGTVLRFAAVFFSLLPGTTVITGTERLLARPLKPLLDALTQLGGSALFKSIKGKPSLVVQGGRLLGGNVSVDASQSSQFASALLLCAPAMAGGLELRLTGRVVSEPYIEMTLGLLQQAGVVFERSRQCIHVPHQDVKPFRLRVENDWSSASYLFIYTALARRGTRVLLRGLSLDSLQGDGIAVQLWEAFGVKSRQAENGVVIRKTGGAAKEHLSISALQFPDLVPALTATALGLGVPVTFKGIAHLRYKESDRVSALVETCRRFGATARATRTSFTVLPPTRLQSGVMVETYNDHRIAMAFAPLALRSNGLTIENPDVVVKSFPGYWDELRKLGFLMN